METPPSALSVKYSLQLRNAMETAIFQLVQLRDRPELYPYAQQLKILESTRAALSQIQSAIIFLQNTSTPRKEAPTPKA